MTDKNTADAKQPKNSTGANFKGSIVDVKKIIAPVSQVFDQQYSKSSTAKSSQFGYNIVHSSNTRKHEY